MPMQLSLLTPPISWKAPPVSSLPDLSNEPVIAVDTETYDPKLSVMGPGFIRGEAYVCGVSVAVPGWSAYIPLRHWDGNIDDIPQATKWLRDILSGDGTKLAANIHYDMDALQSLGIQLGGRLYDVQMADALVDDDLPSFSLESISQRRLGFGKQDAELKQMLADTRADWSNMPQFSAGHVADYAIRDATLLLDIYRSQQKDITEFDLHKALERECTLTRVLWDMHQVGIRIDVDKAEQISQEWKKRADDHLQEAFRRSPIRFNPDSSKSLAKLLQERGVGVPKTAKGNPSIGNDLLRASGDEILEHVYEYRRLNKIRRDFIDGLFLEYNTRGRIHPQWFQSRHTEKRVTEGAGGAGTGRITGSKPNLTQIPSRDKELGPLTRSLVLPEEGATYCKLDYSSQEPRITLSLACRLKSPGAAEARQLFIDDKRTDFHQMTRDMFEMRSGRSLTRREAKDINLGLTYAMGKPKLARKLGMDLEAADLLFREYHEAVPFIKDALTRASDRAQEMGYIRTMGGRIRRFKQWESTRYGAGGIYPTRDLCLITEGSARRAKTHKALNSAVQGSAADQIKEAMIECWANGYLPLLQVYDELGFSTDTEQTGKIIGQIMEEALPMDVPALCEPEFGPNWGETK